MFGKLPIAWLQLRHQPVRLLVALSGVVFSVVIIFMQLGLKDALLDTAVLFHRSLQGDCFLISPRSTALVAMENFPERRLYQTLAFDAVDSVSPIYLGMARLQNPAKRNYWRNIFVIGFDIRSKIWNLPGVAENQYLLQLPDTVLFDRDSRPDFGPIASELEKNGSLETEIKAGSSIYNITIAGLFQLGVSFGADGNLLTSHLNFLKIFDGRSPGFIDIGLIQLKPGTNITSLVEQLRRYLPSDVQVFSKQEFIDFEQKYWNSGTAIGFIFTFGTGLAILVGIVVVYQILYTNVTEHLPEYATLKAIGYPHKYLSLVVFQQAIIIAVLGFIPGFLLSMLLYDIAARATHLPMTAPLPRIMLVLILTIVMCGISGASAIAKLKSADPADIFS
ncbi:ABC transporter permease DevC [Chroococcus sp. FPU101]|uniref:ABC transporter permease DevC n=1 Tax=Chroococcus sp. FPU101 TaxID=1974212 RepID=UPI001A8CDC9D|nr:ABC transporter permease DevC [Chroococcus sp. FPU101]GFE69552.1 DevC protein [Chroococcus sp. FPU101]